MRSSVASQKTEFSRAYGISNGSCGLRPINRLWRVSQYSENIPMFTKTRMVAPRTPIESAPSFKMCATGLSSFVPGRARVPPGNYSDAVWPDEFVIVVISWISREPVAVPFLARVLVELRIWKKPEAENARWFAVNFFVDAGRLGRDLLVQPETEFRIGLGRGTEARL